MATFERAIPTILKHEGGYVNNANDPGGATNYGISIRFLLKDAPELLSQFDFDQDGDVDAEDMKLMPVESAVAVYRSHWWDKFKYEQINDQAVATKLMDMSVNMGASQAHKLCQRALRSCAIEVVEDGVLGPRSFAAINTVPNAEALLAAMRSEQAGFYRVLVATKASFSEFLKGWLRRAYS